MQKFNFRVEDLEARSCGKHLLSGEKHDRAEIVKWAKDTIKKRVLLDDAFNCA